MTGLFNIEKNRWWAALPLIVLIWHSIIISLAQSSQFLFFVCYPANLILIIGIVLRLPLCIGVGFGWTFIGLPLWAYSAYLVKEIEISCLFFHITGLFVGFLAVRDYRLPRFTWFAAIMLAVVMYILSRLFTDERFNINAAFRVYDGWETVFSNYTIYILSMIALFSVYFLLLTTVCNLIFHRNRS